MESKEKDIAKGDKYHDVENIPINLSPLTDNSNKDLDAFSDDVSSWHDARTSRKMVIAQNIDRYLSTSTIHGLSRIFTGNKSEKVLWSLFVVGGFIMAMIIIYGLIIRYMTYNVYTEISSQVTNRYQLPSITFCEGRALKNRAEYAYCGIAGYSNEEMKKYVNSSCPERKKYIPNNFSNANDGSWSNGYFTIIACKSSGVLRDCNSWEYVRSSALYNNSCFTWNYAGNIYSNLFESSEITFEFNNFYDSNLILPSIIAYIHEPGTENDFSRSINLIPGKTTRLEFDKTVIKRLPSPFPSKCTRDKSGDIFPGIYSRIACLKSRGMIHLYKKCGDVFDFVKDLIPYDIREKYARNDTVKNIMDCLYRVLQSYENEGLDNCPLPCEELDFDINQSVLDGILEGNVFPDEFAYSVVVYFPRPGTYKVMEEKELYPWDQIACELGGFVGIALGCSLLSLVEIAICLILSFIKWMV